MKVLKCPIHDNTVNKSTTTTTTTATTINNYVVEKEIEVIKEPKGPCSYYLKDIAKSVDTYNRMYNGKMKELELSNLIISELLDSSKCPSSCLFTSVGDLSKDGYIKCLVHNLYSKDIDKKIVFKI